jgi:polyisoprenoid-binding protein YceI
MAMTTTEIRTPLPTGTWKLDPVHSQVGFAVEYMVGTFRGTFSPVEATLEVTEDGTAALTGRAPVTGVKVLDENLSAHLQSPEFFDAERAPEITFRSTDIRGDGDRVEVDGELAIKGVVVPVQLAGTISDPANDPFGNVRIGLDLSTTIDRTDFGIDWNNPLPNGQPALSNEVTLTAALYLVKEQ